MGLVGNIGRHYRSEMLIYTTSVCECSQRSLGNSSQCLVKHFYLVVMALLVVVLSVVVVGAGAMSLTC